MTRVPLRWMPLPASPDLLACSRRCAVRPVDSASWPWARRARRASVSSCGGSDLTVTSCCAPSGGASVSSGGWSSLCRRLHHRRARPRVGRTRPRRHHLARVRTGRRRTMYLCVLVECLVAYALVEVLFLGHRARELRHSKESASASEISKTVETFDDSWTKVIQNLGFRGVRVRILCACGVIRTTRQSERNAPARAGTCRTPLWTHRVDSFDLLKNPRAKTLRGKNASTWVQVVARTGQRERPPP